LVNICSHRFRHGDGRLHVLLAARGRHVCGRSNPEPFLLTMKWESICYALGILGLILTGVGRFLLVNEAAAVSNGWKWAVRLLPLADIMFLARFWESAKV